MRVRLFLIGIVLVLLAVTLPYLSLAQSAPDVQLGQPISGRLTADRLEARYAYQGQAGDRLTIAVESSFDSYVEFQDDIWQRLAANDDAAALDVTLARSGLFYIYVSSYSGLSTGDYTLRVDGDAVQQVADLTNISYGQTAEGELDSDVESVPFSFQGSAGDNIRITLNTSEFDAFLTLENLDGDVLASDDNSGGETDALLEFTLADDGTYIIQVLDAFGQESGAFSLRLDLLENGEPVIFPTIVPAATLPPDPAQPTAVPTPAPVSGGDTLVFGGSVTGILEGQPFTYTFEGTAGQTVVLILESDDFDPFVSLLDSDGTVLASDDDSAGSLNALLEFTLPADGTYSVEVTSFFSNPRGTYTLSLGDGAAVAMPTNEPSGTGGDDTVLAFGDTVQGELTRRENLREYTFEGEAGQLVTITQVSDDFDSFLRLFGPDGDELASDDDGGGSLNSQISSFALPANGTYTISAESLSGSATGDFELTLDVTRVEALETNVTVSGRLSTEGDAVQYTFTGQAGDVVMIAMTSDDFDTYLYLYAPGQSDAFAFNDDSNGANSLVGPVTLPEDGVYRVEARAYSDGGSGRFEITLTQPEVTALESGQEVEAVLDAESQIQVFRINGQAATHLEMRLSGEGEVNYFLRGPDGFNVLSNFVLLSTEPPHDATVVLNQDGEYLLVVQPGTPSEDATFTVRVTSRELESLSDGPQIARFSDTRFENAFQFEGEGGQRYRLVLAPAGRDIIALSPTVDVLQNGVSIAYISSSQVDTLELVFTVPEDGQVVVRINDYSYSTAELEVRLEPVE